MAKKIIPGILRGGDNERYYPPEQESGQGAPEDFAGPVYPNPNGIKVLPDTDSGIAETRLPKGISLSHGNYTGGAKMKTIGDKDDPYAEFQEKPKDDPYAEFSSGGKSDKRDEPPKEQPGILDREIPLTSYGNATLQGVQNIGRGLKQGFQGMYELFKPNISVPTEDENILKHPVAGLEAAADRTPGIAPILRIGKSLYQTGKQATEIPAAISDINASPDPIGTYAQAAGRTSGEGAGQIASMLATEGAIKGVAPKIVPKIMEGASDLGDVAASRLRYPATARQSMLGRPGTVKNILPPILQRWTIPEGLIPEGRLGTPTNPGPFAEIPVRIPKGAGSMVESIEGGGESAMPRPLRPTVGTPEEWARYEDQMKRLKSEASDAGMYSAARGKAGKKFNYQQRIEQKF